MNAALAPYDGPYELYRITDPDGSSRDRALGAAPDGSHQIVIWEGRTGRRMKLKLVPLDADDTATALNNCRAEAQRDGYYYVGPATVFERHILPIPRSAASGGSEPLLLWELVAPILATELTPCLQAIARTLPPHLGGVCELRQCDAGLAIHLERETWSIGAGTSSDGHIDSQTGRGGGCVHTHNGPMPFLVLASLAQRFPKRLAFADNHGTELDLLDPLQLRALIDGRIDRECLERWLIDQNLRLPSLADFPIHSGGMWL
jgi:hypothetical protein